MVAPDPGPESLRDTSYAVVRGMFDQATTERLAAICDRVLTQWRRAPRSDNPPAGPQANYMRHVNDPDYHRDHPDDLSFLLDALGSPKLVASIQTALQEDFLFALASLYFNPTGESEDGFWHKDKIGEEANVSKVPETGAGLQIQIALDPTEDLELIPGSHLRDYTEEEHAICIADDGLHNRSNEMPGALRLSLEPGDAALFTQLCIHRGRYHTDILRRTLMLSVKKRAAAEHSVRHRGLDYACDQPWFLLPGYLDGVSPEAQSFFQEFIDFYGPRWKTRLTEMIKYSSLMLAMLESGENPFLDPPR